MLRSTKGPTITPRLGQVATRSTTANLLTVAGIKHFQSKSAHYFPNAVVDFKIVLQGWIGNGGTDAGIGSDTTVNSAWFEYPVGTFTSIKFSSSSNGTITSGQNLTSDTISVPVSDGTMGYIYLNQSNATQIYYGGNVTNTALGEAMTTSSSPISFTPGDTVVNNTVSGASLSSPAAIIGLTIAKSISINGDSLGVGTNDGFDIQGNHGYIARSVGPFVGYINMAFGGSNTSQWAAANAPQRSALANLYCTDVFWNLGVNDTLFATTALQTQARLTLAYNAFLPLRSWQSTLTMFTGSSNSWIDAAGQTPDATSTPKILDINTWIRGTPSPLSGYFDPYPLVESSPGSGLWLFNGTTNYATADGLHPTAAATRVLVLGNVIPRSTFT